MAISIKNIKLNTKTVTLEFPTLPVFKVDIGYISNELTRKILKDSHVMKFDEATGVSFEDVDSDKFAKLFCKHAIVGWKGLTVGVLSELMLLDIDADTNLEEEVIFSEDNAFDLYLNCTPFSKWVTGAAKSLTQFRTK